MANKKNTPNGAEVDQAAQQGFIQRKIKSLGIGLGIVLVVVLACVLASNIISKRSQKAAEALYPCEQYFLQGNYDMALNGDGQTCEGFLGVAGSYGSTKSGNLAKLYAGICQAQLGNWEEAKANLEKFSSKNDEMISPAALGALGNVYAQLGDNEKAASTLVKAAKKADNNVLSPLYLVQAGEIFESMGKQDKALELYEQVKDNYRASMQGQEIDKYIERAKLTK